MNGEWRECFWGFHLGNDPFCKAQSWRTCMHELTPVSLLTKYPGGGRQLKNSNRHSKPLSKNMILASNIKNS